MLPLGLTVVLLCVAAGGASQSFAAQTTVALAACLGFTLASQIILGAQQESGGAIFVQDRSRAESAQIADEQRGLGWVTCPHNKYHIQD